MTYLKEEAIVPGSMLRLEHKGQFEGYAKLIEPTDEGMTQRRSDNAPLIVKQRWLIEWMPVDKIAEFLSPSDRITQITLKNRRTHRNILYLAAPTRREDSYSIDNNVNRTQSDFDIADDYSEFY